MASMEWPPKFTIDAERVLNLFTGDRFYSSADAAIREAVLNAIDACGRRRQAQSGISPNIEVIFDNEANTVTVSDNGDGMGRTELGELFAKIGASASELAQHTDEEQYKAIGEFGIGVVSYFLVCDRYQVHSMKEKGEPIGLEFMRSMLDAITPARPVSPLRNSIGTTTVFFVLDATLFKLLLERFSHWVRDVDGLSARKLPDDKELSQGGLSTHILPIQTETPEWIERAQLGPPSVFDVWDHLDGKGHVDVLYRGVFIDRIEVDRLWGIEGSIHVDPKHFKPKLNREGFVGEQLKEEVARFLQVIHPEVLRLALDCMRDVLTSEETKEWTILKWATLWLAIPRSGAYEEVANAWDEEFRNRKAFRMLLGEEQYREVSVAELQDLHVDKIYVAPTPLASTSDLVKQSVRVLQAQGLHVVQGVRRDKEYLGYATMVSQSTAELLVNHFRDVLPDLIQVESVAEEIVKQETVTEVYVSSPEVRLVQLGPNAAPLVNVRDEIWINIEVASGKRIVLEICDRNEGHLGLWAACLRHAPEHAHQIAKPLRKTPESPTRLGLVGTVKFFV